MHIYQTLIRLLSPIILLALMTETLKRHGGKRFFRQRLGWGYPNIPANTHWIHCASVGEVSSIEMLVKALPNTHFLITTNTPTGADRVQQLFSHRTNQIQHAYLPLDWKSAVKRFLTHFNAPNIPSLWVVETEIWPNLYQQVAQQQIPITIINARLSKKTLNTPQWLQKTYQTALQNVHAILARSQEEAERFKALGVPSEKINILGNLKYAGLTQLPPYDRPIQEDYILLASSHEDEERQIAELIYRQTSKESANITEKLIIVPRHPKRGKAIAKTLRALNFTVALQSETHTLPSLDKIEIMIDDQIGTLMPWFAFAKIVIMGGSFVPAGGHNVLEPAAVAAPILTGPDMSDFIPETQLLLKHQGIIQCHCLADLTQQLTDLLTHKTKRQTLGQQAKSSLSSQAHILEDYLKNLNNNNPVK